MNGFASEQYVPSPALVELDVAPTIDTYCTRAVAELHARGGVASWNHPFGAVLDAPLLSAAEARTLRRETFSRLLAKRAYGATLLEVGYPARSGMPIEEHLALWDTLSRHGLILTGNGVSDDHVADDWRLIENGFGTGLWSRSASTTDLVAAMKGGRAYTRHAGRWPGGELDMLLAGSVPMGGVLLGAARERDLTVTATDLPPSSTLEIVEGLVDHAGLDPATSVVASVTAARVGSDGTWSMTWRPSGPAFVRAQVRDSFGKVVGIGNPCFLLPESARAGVAPERLHD